MNGQHEQGGQAGQDSHLSFLLNAANGQNALMGYPGAGGLGGGNGFGRYGVSDASLEEQILQRASALRAEALMQQQQQQQHQQQRQHQLGAALAALQQQQQLSSLAGLNPNFAGLSAQEQEALLGRAAALRELGISGGPAAAALHGGAAGGMERLQQLELGRLEELERRRQQLAALANLSNGSRPPEGPQGGEQLGQDSIKSDRGAEKEAQRVPKPTAEKSKDELRKTPGTVIVPCRARGMPMDHNFKTAYFVISEDAKHGEDLVCSYFACRNGGVKFRYCAHCMAPVAKRNFCRRHDHGMSAKAGGGDNNDEDETSMDHSEGDAHKDEPEEPVSNAKTDEPSPKPASKKNQPAEAPKPAVKVEEKEAKDVSGSSLDVLSKAATSSFLMQAEPQKNDESEAKRKKPVKEEEQQETSDEAELANISGKRRKMWSALLIKRPRTKDPRHLSSWLNEVLTVSDFETPLDQADSPTPKVFSSESPIPPSDKSKPQKETDGRPSNKEKEREKKNSDKERKKRKIDSKAAEDGAPSSKARKEKEEKTSKKGSESSTEKKSPKKSGSKDSPSRKDSEDRFVGSFADWRDRKKEKALSKKGTGSLRK